MEKVVIWVNLRHKDYKIDNKNDDRVQMLISKGEGRVVDSEKLGIHLEFLLMSW
jgi:hypothetical protein